MGRCGGLQRLADPQDIGLYLVSVTVIRVPKLSRLQRR